MFIIIYLVLDLSVFIGCKVAVEGVVAEEEVEVFHRQEAEVFRKLEAEVFHKLEEEGDLVGEERGEKELALVAYFPTETLSPRS